MAPEDDLRIREATLLDVAPLIALLQELFSLESEFAPDPPRQRAGLELLLGCPDNLVLVAEQADAVIGMCTLQTLVSTAEGGRVGLVEDVVVAPGHRGRGVGRRLLAELEGWAVERGLTRLQLLAEVGNTGARRFYARLGWRPTRLIGLRKHLPAGGDPADQARGGAS